MAIRASDSPEAIADLCSEMHFLDREWLRVALLNAKQQLIKVCTVSQGSVELDRYIESASAASLQRRAISAPD